MTVRSCSIVGCNKPHLARGWCAMHYQRWFSSGDAGEASMRRVPGDSSRTSKPCTKCGEQKKLEEFYADPRNRDGRMSYCKLCFGVQQRAIKIRRKYGITVEQYDELLIAQDERCAICRAVVELVVDHDHETGAVRGLLCNGCNTALGMAHDDPARLRAAADYLEVAVMAQENEMIQ